MTKNKSLSIPVNPTRRLFDLIIEKHNLKNDAQLARFINITTSSISKMSNGALPIGDSTLLKIHETTGLTLEVIRLYIPKKTTTVR